ncbi:S8 family serine peptidase [Alkaliphilus peptidifermentans]|uniref:Minor extracellular protease Epr n=1 Tax=Alkaliphilus peptidifermentans DSM 18978 TaxID=1120976 RepID=A0A1G5L0Z7_9FIRM|nr:S8 family serine peptidase [Alkaliphilus peptidifermentans]SCZ06532.1 minor extracellular protease Epr [Alkaliphilus peptidifermentans DSM 18978]
MKKYLSIITVLLMIMSMFSFSFADEATHISYSNTQEYVEGQLIISLEGDSYSIQKTDDLLAESLQDNGFAVVDYFLNLGQENSVQAMSNEFKELALKTMGEVYLVEYSKDYASIDDAISELKTLLTKNGLSVKYIEPNYTVHVLDDDVSINMHNNQRWHYEMINAPQAWNITTGSSNVRMAVLDTGIDHNHVSLSNLVNTSLGRSYVGGTTMDRHGHGTHVAGTIASYGVVSGVMKNATLIPVKVLGDDGSGSMYGIQQGILYAASINSDVINMSLGGGGYSQSVNDACQTAVNNGTIVVAASGNDGKATISYPAAYSSVIAVGSVTSSRTRSSFSNYGTGLDLVAPGSNIYSTYPNNQYRTFSGTSMASPHVAGVAGLLRSVNPNITPTQARNILKSTAQPAGSAYEYGAGIVDAFAAVQAAGGGTQPNETVTALATNKTSYLRGESVTITATVRNQNNNPLQGATVLFTITRPNGTTLTQTATTNSSGVATWTVTSNSQTALGTYTVKADTTLSGYASSSATTTFRIVSNIATDEDVSADTVVPDSTADTF